MKKVIRETDEKRGIVQITVADERWYSKPGRDPATGVTEINKKARKEGLPEPIISIGKKEIYRSACV